MKNQEEVEAESKEETRPFCPNCGEKCDDISENLSSKEYHIFNCEKCQHTCQIRWTRGHYKVDNFFMRLFEW